MSKSRIKWLDFAKGLTILSVVMIHIPSNLSSLFLIFAMPIFFAISGYLYNPTNNWTKFKNMLYKKSTSFIIPYVAFTLLLIIRRILEHRYVFVVNHNYLLPIAYLWFLYVLFFIFIIVGIMDVFHFNLYVELIIACILLIAQLPLSWKISSNGDVNPIAGICGYMICFYIGYIIKRFKFYKFVKCNFNILYLLCILWAICVVIQMCTTNVNINNDMFYYQNIITKLLSIPVFFAIFINFPKNKIFRYFDKYGKYTLIIYLVHFPIVAILKNMKISSNAVIKYLVILFIAWYVSIFVCYLSKRISFIDFIFYPRKYINKLIVKLK